MRNAATAAQKGISVSLLDGLGEIPLYNQDEEVEGLPRAVTSMAEKIRSANGLLITTPEYNYGVPGVLKNALDWLSRTSPQPFSGKPIGIMGASPGMMGSCRAQYDLRRYLTRLDGYVMNRPEVFVGAADTKFNEKGELIDDRTIGGVTHFMESFVNWMGRMG